jgi:hypothetical protein
LQLQDGPAHSKPKPKQIVRGSTAAAKQVAFYDGGMLHTHESSRAAGAAGAEVAVVKGGRLHARGVMHGMQLIP